MRILASFILCCMSLALHAQAIDELSPRLSAQLLVGTAGFEPGLAAEWRWRQSEGALSARPEIFVNDDGRIGGGASLGWRVDWSGMNTRHDLTIGPRIVFHNSDDDGWEASAMAIYAIPITSIQPERHFIQVIGAVGVLEDTDDDDTDIAATMGAAYALRF